jgi:Rrf2 family iron-sulfur cluster assembly transcriptional regulator
MAVITRETDYAFRALARLAAEGEFLPVSALAEAVDVPEVFLRKIMQRLHGAGLVESRQGPFGGYRLHGGPDEVSLLDVVEATQGPLVMNECFAEPEVCKGTESCPLRARLQSMQEDLSAQLAGMSLAQLAGKHPSQTR